MDVCRTRRHCPRRPVPPQLVSTRRAGALCGMRRVGMHVMSAVRRSDILGSSDDDDDNDGAKSDQPATGASKPDSTPVSPKSPTATSAPAPTEPEASRSGSQSGSLRASRSGSGSRSGSRSGSASRSESRSED
jgi:hypothetical protein